MLCFFCIIEDRTSPSEYVTFVDGTAVCREHAAATQQAPQPTASSPEVLALVQKLKEVTDRVKQQRISNNTLTGSTVDPKDTDG